MLTRTPMTGIKIAPRKNETVIKTPLKSSWVIGFISGDCLAWQRRFEHCQEKRLFLVFETSEPVRLASICASVVAKTADGKTWHCDNTKKTAYLKCCRGCVRHKGNVSCPFNGQ